MRSDRGWWFALALITAAVAVGMVGSVSWLGVYVFSLLVIVLMFATTPRRNYARDYHGVGARPCKPTPPPPVWERHGAVSDLETKP